MTGKTRILFLCTGNSCRSQMAEALANSLRGGDVQAWSAGVETHGLNPLAVKVMSEIGLDISGAKSKMLDEVLSDVGDDGFDLVVTLCGHAHESCPVFPGMTKRIHVGFDDPPALARDAENEEQAMGHYRRVRDEIKEFIEKFPDFLPTGHSMN